MEMKIILVAGARPNFMKIAPIIRALKHRKDNALVWKLVHTGQHYDHAMSQTFFDDLGIPEPDYFFEAGSGTHAEQTSKIMVAFEELCEKEMIDIFGLKLSDNIIQLEPLGFKESLFLWKDAVMVLTDSGGLQEETTGLGIPCYTVRENTERPVTITEGTNTLIGTSGKAVWDAYRSFISGNVKKGTVPKLWDGKSAERIVDVLLK